MLNQWHEGPGPNFGCLAFRTAEGTRIKDVTVRQRREGVFFWYRAREERMGKGRGDELAVVVLRPSPITYSAEAQLGSL